MKTDQRGHYRVTVPFRTVKGVDMLGKRFPVESQTERTVSLRVVATGEIVEFTRKEVL
jgi:hypothetical protein